MIFHQECQRGFQEETQADVSHLRVSICPFDVERFQVVIFSETPGFQVLLDREMCDLDNVFLCLLVYAQFDESWAHLLDRV